MSAALALHSTPESFAGGGEFPFTRRNFACIAALLREQSGIALTEMKSALVYSRLAKRLRKLGLADFDAYCALVESEAGESERIAMLAALTTNVTRFFREPHHFEHFQNQIAPKLAERARAGGRVRLWSAACSSGEEPYSLALSLLSVMPDAARYDVRMLATDIDPDILARARRGVYSDEAVSPIDAPLRSQFLSRTNEGWRVGDAARELIAFKPLNLVAPAWPMRGSFDVIFCRNVVIYFDDETQLGVWTRMRSMLAAEGRLYVGHSERVEANGFVSDGLTIYCLAQGSAR